MSNSDSDDGIDHRKHGKKGGEKTKALYGSEYYRIVGALGGQKSAATRRGKRRGPYRRWLDKYEEQQNDAQSPADSGTETAPPKRATG